MSSEIIDYLNTDRNSRIREQIFKYAFFHDIKLAATKFKINLKVYEPEVDNEGCDVIIENELDFSRKIQLKSIYHTQTRQWKIHKSILLPGFSQMNDYGLDSIICPSTPGAVVLIDASHKLTLEGKNSHQSNYPQNDYKYLYTDINIIFLISRGVIGSTKQSVKHSLDVISKIKNPDYYGKINIRKSLFVEVQGPIGLLGISGFGPSFTFVNSANKLIRNYINKSSFFSTIPNYNPHDHTIIEKSNELLINDTQAHRYIVDKELKELIIKI